MNDEISANPDRDEWNDRLIDGGLREVVGGEKPPQLSERILAAAGVAGAVATTAGDRAAATATSAAGRSWLGWLSFAVAACLLIGVGVGLLRPSYQAARETSGRATQSNWQKGTAPAPVTVLPLGEDLRYATPTDGEATEYGTAPAESTVDMLAVEVHPSSGPAPKRDEGEKSTLDLGLSTATSEAKGLQDFGMYSGDGQQAGGQRGEQGGESGQQGESQQGQGQQGAGDRGGGQQSSHLAWQASDGAQRLNESLDLFAVTPPAGTTPLVRHNFADVDQPETFKKALVEDGFGTSPRGEQLGEETPQSGATTSSGLWAEADSERIRERLYDNRGIALAEPSTEGRGRGAERAKLSSEESELLAKDGAVLLGGIQADRRYFRSEVRPLEELGKQQWGRGPASGGDQYAPIIENPFRAISAATTDNRLSTFSIDVDTASYANVRQFLMQSNTLPPPDAVRIEELVNYFDYDYSAPTGDVPFDANVEVAACPWKPEHRLVRVGIKGREIEVDRRPKSNLVFLVDVSGSMDEPNKLPLVLEGLRMLTRELGENDRIAIVVYASSEGLVLESTRGDQQQTILDALNRLSAGGSTAGGAGIVLAYQLAERNFIEGGVNRVILCTDGDFNVGVTSTGDLQRLAEEKAKDTGVFLTVLGFGRGNLNDAMMEAIADHGNGNYHYVDNRSEARKVLVEELAGTLVTIAKDVKIQIEFNPRQVAGYRLIGYENRVLAAEDFNDDKKDAGEIGAGHTVTALYELIPAGQKVDAVAVDELKYAPVESNAATAVDPEAASREDEDGATRYAGDDADGDANAELLTLKIRYKQPDGDESTKLEFPVTDNGQAFNRASADFQFASAVAGFGMLLRGSQFRGDATFAGILEIAASASRDRDANGYRREFCEMIDRAKVLSGE
jgi:secreted protein with Ig-like and vWFA domain